MTSPLASVAAALVANGFSPIPIRPDAKAPGLFARDAWFNMRDWSRFCDRAPTNFELKQWQAWPDSNVGVACGLGGLVAFDIDRDALVEPMLAVLPPAVVAKRGQKGLTVFYRTAEAIPSRGFKIDKLGAMDLISVGKQTVLPPSIHPDTREPYVWTTARTLLDTRLDELPEVTLAHVEAVIEVLRGFGYEPEPERLASQPAEGVDDGSAGREFYRALNDDALANLHAWVPKLSLQNIKREGDHYRAAAEWRPSNSNKPIMRRTRHVAIHPKGIVDYGDGEKKYTALDLVMVVFGLSQYQIDKAAVWLGECLGMSFAPQIVLNRGRALDSDGADPEPESDGTGLSDAEFAEMERLTSAAAKLPAVLAPAEPIVFDPVTGEVFDELKAINPEGLAPDVYMDALTHVPGFVGDLVDWIVSSSAKPCRTLAFSIALAFVGTLAGRVYKTPTNLRTNIYTIALAGTGFGKAHAIHQVNLLIEEGGLSECIGGSDIASGTAMRKRIEHRPAIMWMIDEVGGLFRRMSDPRNSHGADMCELFLKLFSQANDVFRGTDYAAERGFKVVQPCVSLTGCTTPEGFWNSAKSASISDGLLPRMLVFMLGRNKPKRVDPSVDIEFVPEDLIRRAKSIAAVKSGGNMAGRVTDATTAPKPMAIPWGAGAKEAYDAACERFDDIADQSSEFDGKIFSRVCEHAQKIAAILAIGVDPERPILTADLFARGLAIAEHCSSTMAREMKGRIADNDRQREHVDVYRWIVESGKAGITRTEISRKVRGRFNSLRLTDILETLEKDEKTIIASLAPNKNGGPRGAVYTASPQ